MRDLILESLEGWKRNSDPSAVKAMEAMEAEGLVRAPGPDEAPTIIIGVSWSRAKVGSLRCECDDCGCWIGLGPDSGEGAAAKWPDVPILCFPCAHRHIQAAKLETV